MGNEQSAPGYRADYRHLPTAPPRQETAGERAARLERAALYEDKTKKFQRKDPAVVKQENWRKYAEIDKEKLQREGATSPTIEETQQQPTRRIITGSGMVGTAISKTSSSSSPSPPAPSSSVSPPPYDPDPARAARAAAMTAKTAKIKHHKTPIRADQWDTYKQLEALKLEQRQAVPITAAPSQSLSLTSNAPSNVSPEPNHYGPGIFATVIDEEEEEKQRFAETIAPENPQLATNIAAQQQQPQHQQQQSSLIPPTSFSSAAASDPSNSAFYQQMFFLIGKAQRMPAASLTLLSKILSNLLMSNTSPDGQKYRRIKLDAERIQRDIIAVDGAIEILIAVGFERQVGANDQGMVDEVLIFPTDTPLNIAQMALQKIQEIQQIQSKK